MSGKGIVPIHGKQYKTVVLRVNEFRENCNIQEGWGINTIIVYQDDAKVIMRAMIVDPEGRIVGSGHGEEIRAQGKINKTSAMENAETSAIGRALASVGLGGEEYASADEVLRAISQQEEPAIEETEATSVPPEHDLWPISAVPPEDDTAWEDTTELSNTIKNNIKIGIDKMGEDVYKIWHKRVLQNMFGVDTVKELTDAESMRRFVVMQDERFQLEKG